MKKRMFSLLLAIVMAVGCIFAFSTTALAAPIKYGDFQVETDVENGCSFADKVLNINAPGTYTISMADNVTTTKHRIVVNASASDAVLILDNVHIDMDNVYEDALTLNGDVSIEAKGTVKLTGQEHSTNAATAINTNGKTLTFLGGIMNVKAGAPLFDSAQNGRYGIRGKGEIIVQDGTLTVSGGEGGSISLITAGGGGIGIEGDVTVNGGFLKVTGGNSGSGAGGGTGGTGISGSLTVNGGEARVKGGSGGDARGADDKLGAGGTGIYGSLTVNGGSVSVDGGDGGKYNGKQAIGGYGVYGTTTIDRGTVTATGGNDQMAFSTIPSVTSQNRQITIRAGSNSYNATDVENYTNENYAQYKVIGKYQITYVGIYGTVVETRPRTHLEGTPTMIPDPTKTGYTFDGWVVNGTGDPEKNLTLGANDYSADITLEAKWTVNTYTITFDNNGADIPVESPNYAVYGSDLQSIFTEPGKTGYDFVGWYLTDAEGKITDTPAPETMPAGDISLIAKWIGTEHTPFILVEGGGTVTLSSDKPRTEDVVTVTATPAEGYELVKLLVGDLHMNPYTVTDGQFTVGANGVGIEATFKLKTYTIAWDTNGDGTVDKSDTVEYGKTPTAPTASKANVGCTKYTFSKWDKEIKAVTEDVTYTAIFTDSISHTWGNWNTTKEPTVTLEGEKSRACAVCGKTEKETVPALGVSGSGECKQDETCPIHSFVDAKASAWYHDGVHFCLETGLMNGTGEKTFDPNGDASRAMIVTILWRQEGSPTVAYDMTFEDVPTGKWYTEAVRWATSEGIVTGYSDNKFGPDDDISREQLATILSRYCQVKGYVLSTDKGTGFDSMPDVSAVSDWAKEGVEWTYNTGLIQGAVKDGAVALAPQDGASRCQTATILYRYNLATIGEE